MAIKGRARLLDVVQGRSGTALAACVSAREPAWRDGITVAALYPFRGYATALRTTLFTATRVLDAFHVTRLGFDAVDQVRRPVQQQTWDNTATTTTRCSASAGCCAAGSSTTPDRSWARLLAGRDAGAATSRSTGRGSPPETCGGSTAAAPAPNAERHLRAWFTAVAEHEIPELLRLAPALSTPGARSCCAYFDTGGISNGLHRSGQRADQENQRSRARIPHLH